MKHFRIYIIIFIVLISANYSCKKMIELGPPPDQLVTEDVFADTANAKSAVLGIYGNIMSSNTAFGFANGGVTALTGLSSDELFPTATNSSDIEFYNNAISSQNSKISTVLWRSAYKIIYQTNACLEGLSNSEELIKTPIYDSIRKQLMGECKVVRALVYFNLFNLFGDVPLITSTDYKTNRIEVRAPKDSVYNQIINDLTEAKQLLATNYVTAGRVRPNKYTAVALLSRVKLYQEKWDEAETISTEIINSGQYLLETNINDVFLATSREAIWQIRPYQTGYETTEGQLFIPTTTATAAPAYPLSDSLLNAFEVNDKRKINNNWIKSKVIGTKTYYHPYKYKLRNDNNTTPLENYMVFRLAEQYLIRAEARAQQNKLPEAQSDLNMIRRRAGLPDVNLVTKLQVLAAIERERRVELFAEWGHRWYDLKRTHRVDDVLSITKNPNWQSMDALYPIPFDEIELNPFLIQNTGY